MALELVDSHTHLSAPDFAADLEQVISRAAASGVSILVNIGAGYGIESAKEAVEVAKRFPGVYCSVGIHPHNAACPLSELDNLRSLASYEKVVAIGETGLDFFRDWSPQDMQHGWFEAQIKLALEINKPLIIHSRDAGRDCIEKLKKFGAEKVGGVFHCFAEDSQFAAELRDINFLVSFPGTITFKNAEPLRQIVREIPLDQIMLETDAPYMAPVPNRGKRCESSFLLDTARAMADIKGITLEELAAVTTATAKRFFRIA